MAANPSRTRRRQAGFTLIELAISLIVVVEVLLGVLLLFDFTNKLSHAQTNIADLQQSLRTTQSEMEGTVRMSGRGGLPFSIVGPGGLALWVRDNLESGASVPNRNIGDPASPLVVDDTDILTVRGVFATPVYQINSQDTTTIEFRDIGGVVTTDPAVATTVKLTIKAIAPTSIPQSLQPLADAVAAGISEACVLEDASDHDNHAVVELIPAASTVNVATQAVLVFKIRGNPADLVTSYAKLGSGGVYPPKLSSVTALGILEEYRYYVRRAYAIANNAASEPTPKLSRARFMPGTDIAYGPTGGANSANLAVDLADNVLDLQIALGLDTPNHVARTRPPGAPAEPPGLTTVLANPANGYISEAVNGVDDDWLYNSTTDNVTNAVWANSRLFYVRLNILARTDRRDWKYEAPLLGTIEDRIYLSTNTLNVANSVPGSKQQRQYRRRILQTVIDPRNL